MYFIPLISFIPQYKIEGPETFHRIAAAASISRYICAIIGLSFFLKDTRNGWPWLLVSSFFFLNEFINTLISEYGNPEQLTECVGSTDKPFAFIGTFVGFVILLILTGE